MVSACNSSPKVEEPNQLCYDTQTQTMGYQMQDANGKYWVEAGQGIPVDNGEDLCEGKLELVP